MTMQTKLLSGGSGGNRGFCASGSIPTVPDNLYWKPIVQGATKDWKRVAMSRDGHYQVAAVKNSFLFYSHDYGETWSQVALITGDWMGICCSSDGQYFYALAQAGATGLYKSTDYGVTWVQILNNAGAHNWQDVACDYTGQFILVGVWGVGATPMKVSGDYGLNFVNSLNGGVRRWKCAVSSDATRMYLMNDLSVVYTSVDFGVNWNAGITIDATATLTDRIRCSADGVYLLAYIGGKMLHRSIDSGATWIPCGFVLPAGGSLDPGGDIAMSGDGKIMVCVTAITTSPNYAYMWVSADSGVSWKWFTPILVNWCVDISDDFKYVTRPANLSGGGACPGLIWIRKTP